MTIAVCTGRRSDVPDLSGVLGRAFYDDPVMSWLLPSNESRPRSLRLVFATLTLHHYLAGDGVQVAMDGSVIGAATLWSPPGRWREPRREQLRMLPGMLLALGRRSLYIQNMLERVAKHHPEEPHWYLGFIGSDPSVRGAGFGRELMRSGLMRCDAEHAPTYLECTNPVNVAYYQRFGFEVIGEVTLPPGSPVISQMWRKAR